MSHIPGKKVNGGSTAAARGHIWSLQWRRASKRMGNKVKNEKEKNKNEESSGWWYVGGKKEVRKEWQKKKKKDVGIYRDRFPYCKIYTTHFFNIKTSFHKIWGGGELHLQKLSVMYSYMIEPNNCSKWFLIGHPPILWLANFSELNGPNTFTVHWFSS